MRVRCQLIALVANLLCLPPAFAQADVRACTAADGAVTYTDGRRGDNEKARTVQAAPRQVRTDVESVRAPYEALRQCDARSGDLQIAGH